MLPIFQIFALPSIPDESFYDYLRFFEDRGRGGDDTQIEGGGCFECISQKLKQWFSYSASLEELMLDK